LVSIHGILQVIRSRNPWTELKRKSFSENCRLHYCEQHADVVAALERRDADGAVAAMLGHIEAIEVALFGRRYAHIGALPADRRSCEYGSSPFASMAAIPQRESDR